MTSGQLLKKQLGLEKYSHTYITFVVGSSPTIYLVLWDSMRPNMPISSQYLKSYSNVAFYKMDKELRVSSPMYLEKSNMNLNTGTVVTYDIAMSSMTHREDTANPNLKVNSIYNLVEGKLVEQVVRLKKHYVGKLSEITLKDLKDGGKSMTSPSTYLWFKDRNSQGYKASKSTKLVDTSISLGDNSCTFYFLVEATEGTSDFSKEKGYDYDDPKGEVDTSSFKINANPSKLYEIQIKVLELDKFLDYLKTTPEGTKITRTDIVYLLSNFDCQIFNSASSFHWQGYNKKCSDIGLSIFPTSIESKQWMAKTFNGDYFLDKHTFSLVQNYEFFAQQMGSSLQKKLKDRNLI